MYLPSGEYSGVPSLPGLVVSFFGVAAGHRDDEDIVVGAGGFHLVEIAGVGDFFAVGREAVLVLAAERERRHIMIAGREVERRAAVRCRTE